MSIPQQFRTAQQWLFATPARSLKQAYEAALMIRAIEDEYFAGNPISSDCGDYGAGTVIYFQAELDQCLRIIRVRLTEYRASCTVMPRADQKIAEIKPSDQTPGQYTLDLNPQSLAQLQKLRIIDEVLARYADLAPESNASPSSNSARPDSSQDALSSKGRSPSQHPANQQALDPAEQRTLDQQVEQYKNTLTSNVDGLSDRSSFLPRSIFKTFARIRQEINPNAEKQVVRSFRSSKTKTTTALSFVLLLIIVPLLTQQVSKQFVVGPVVDELRSGIQDDVFLNIDMEEEALHELQRFEERLRFEVLIGKAPPLPELEIEAQVRQKAEEIEEDYRYRSSSAVKNVFSDIFAVAAFGVLLTVSKREIAVLKSFIDEIVYGLSDSAKAFIIILFTDIFVGFHSPHGWEIILEGLSRHLGLPANREFIFLFIATFPVILDTVFKYWIFRYLNRISPSAVATYKTMNE